MGLGAQDGDDGGNTGAFIAGLFGGVASLAGLAGCVGAAAGLGVGDALDVIEGWITFSEISVIYSFRNSRNVPFSAVFC